MLLSAGQREVVGAHRAELATDIKRGVSCTRGMCGAMPLYARDVCMEKALDDIRVVRSRSTKTEKGVTSWTTI
jgi:hypothetical protein